MLSIVESIINKTKKKAYHIMMQFSACFVPKTRGRYKEDLNLFESLPSETVIDILSRLPSCRSIIKCKLVCKAWRDAIESRDFTTYRLRSNPDPHLVMFSNFPRHESETYRRMIELPMQENDNNDMVVVKLGINDSLQPVLRSSVGGLILVTRSGYDHLLVCNPVTNEYEYVRIPNPPEHSSRSSNFGFGMCRKSCQYKVVRISESHCHVYTVGTTTRQWRSVRGGTGVGPDPRFSYNSETERAFVGGNLHWLDPETETRVCCFDLEAEAFTYFTAPPPPHPQSKRSMCVLNDCLCLCDVSPRYEEGGVGVEVWLMINNVWSREFVIMARLDTCHYLFPIKVFEEGSISFCERDSAKIFYYSKDNNEIKQLYPINCTQIVGGAGAGAGVGDFSDQHVFETICFAAGIYFATTAVFTPSFLSLKTLLTGEDIRSFQTS